LTGTGTLDADSLLSSGGANTLVGLYYVNNTNDVVTEAANGGFDSVHAFVDYTLPTNVEALYTIGSGLTVPATVTPTHWSLSARTPWLATTATTCSCF
jgi:hypothetical protein